MSGSLQVPHKCVYVGRVVRGRSVVVGYEDMHLVGDREGLANTRELFRGLEREDRRRQGGLEQFKQVNSGTLRPLAARGR